MNQEVDSPATDSSVTYEELKRHATYCDAWISINGLVYDITHFIEQHPFGDTFRGHLGTECGGLFSSAHCNTNVETLMRDEAFLRRNNIAVVGRLDVSGDHLRRFNENRFLDRIVYKDTDKDEFWQELKTRVTSYIRECGETTHYTIHEGSLLIAYHLVIYLVLSYLTWIHGSFLAAILLAFHMICALANVAHMATHSGFTRSRLLDFIAFHMFDLSGVSGMEWQITHQTHHSQLPTFKPTLLKKISPIVRAVCQEHEIPYISTPFFGVQKSLQQHLGRLGLPPSPTV